LRQWRPGAIGRAMAMKTAVIIQARFTSTRLPGKVLLKVAGRSLLSHVLERACATAGAEAIVCAVARGPAHDGVADEAVRCGAQVTRGPVRDVLARYYLAAKAVGAQAILRVTSDCPLIDPEICAAVLGSVRAGDADFAANNMPPSWPHGLDCEAFSFALLERAHEEARSPQEREHVGPYMRALRDIRKVNYMAPSNNDLSCHRWSVDTQTDLEFVRRLIPRLPAGPKGWSYQATLAVLEADPALARLSRERPEGGGWRRAPPHRP